MLILEVRMRTKTTLTELHMIYIVKYVAISFEYAREMSLSHVFKRKWLHALIYTMAIILLAIYILKDAIGCSNECVTNNIDRMESCVSVNGIWGKCDTPTDYYKLLSEGKSVTCTSLSKTEYCHFGRWDSSDTTRVRKCAKGHPRECNGNMHGIPNVCGEDPNPNIPCMHLTFN